MRKWRSAGGVHAPRYIARYQILCEALSGQKPGALTKTSPVFAPPVEDALGAWESAGRPEVLYINDHARVVSAVNADA